MHHQFWHERWQTGQIGFHQATVHPLLERWWPSFGVRPGARVYVPLCGKSVDMAWLAGRGHRVVGSELSPIAVRDFFASQGLEPAHTAGGSFVRHAAGPYELLEGDALNLEPGTLGAVDAVYDRAALVALPPDMRMAYAASMARLVTAGVAMLLVSLEYPQEMKGGPPFSVDADEIQSVFGPNFAIEVLERVDVLANEPKFAELGIPAVHETVYRLTRT